MNERINPSVGSASPKRQHGVAAEAPDFFSALLPAVHSSTGRETQLDSLQPVIHTDIGAAFHQGVFSAPAKVRRKAFTRAVEAVKGGLIALVVASTLGVVSVGIIAPSAEQARPAVAPVVIDGDKLSAPPSDSLVERAARGEEAATRQLMEKDSWSRTIQETVALSDARLVQLRREVTERGRELALKDPADISRTEIDQALSDAANELTFQAGLTALAQIPNYLGPDLLFRVKDEHKSKLHVVALASELLETLTVSERASPALSIALEADNTDRCDDARALLERAATDADRRAVMPLAKFTVRTGCGPDKSQDCYPCLRTDRIVFNSLRAASDRFEPR